jgi:hypothetical protein
VLTALNHVCWPAAGLALLIPFLIEKLAPEAWDTPVGRLLEVTSGVLFLVALVCALGSSVLALVFEPAVRPSARLESFLSLGFLVLVVLVALWAPSFIEALGRSSAPP